MMQTSNSARKSGFYAYGLVIVLMLVSALVGAIGARAWSPTYSPAPAPAAAPPLAQEEPAQIIRTDSPAAVDELLQEQRDLREAKKLEQGLREPRALEPATSSVLAPAMVGDIGTGEKQLEQEMRDLRQIQRSLRAGAAMAPAETTTAPAKSGYERYWIYKQGQIEGAQ